MAKPQHRTADVARNLIRAGEGTLIAAIPRHSVGTDGQTTVSLDFNLRDAPVPDRRYAADFAAISYKDDAFKIIFGQDKIGVEGIRSLVVIAMAITDIEVLAASIKSLDHPNLLEIAVLANIKDVPLRDVTEEPDQTVALAASYAAVAVSGRVACMDFYSASAFALAEIAKSHKLAVDPVVRIDLPTSYLVALYKAITESISRNS